MQKKTYTMQVYGCQMNERDAETLRGFLDQMGYEEVPEAQDADLVLINTCAVRQKAEEKVFGHIGWLGKLKEKKPNMLIAISGCMVQQEHVAQKIKKRYPFVNLIFGTHNIAEFPELLKKAEERTETVLELKEEAGEVTEGLPVKREDGIKAWVNITYGCNNFCSYCIVPYVRGRERSRRPGDILQEIQDLAKKGYMEITLLGQNVNSYGKDLDEDINFAKLLDLIDREGGIPRIRFMTSHPRDFTNDIIAAIAGGKSICEHVHLPVQAGSNRVLKLMNRGYTREHYLEIVKKIRDAVPGVAITTDIIVGFPGETEEDFADTLALVDEVKFDSAFTFMYSPRRGTPAAKMPGQVDREVVSRRFERLLDLQNRHGLEKNRALLGKRVEVLVEGGSKTNPDVLTGRTRTNKTVNFPGDKALVGKLVEVEITEAKTWSLEGRILP